MTVGMTAGMTVAMTVAVTAGVTAGAACRLTSHFACALANAALSLRCICFAKGNSGSLLQGCTCLSTSLNRIMCARPC
jgi:hypothetical protein